MTFRTTLLLHGKSATGIEIPPEIVEAMGAGKKPPVRVTINGHAFQTTVAPRGGVFLVGVSAASCDASSGLEMPLASSVSTRALREVMS